MTDVIECRYIFQKDLFAYRTQRTGPSSKIPDSLVHDIEVNGLSGLRPERGTNSARLFTPGKSKALAKSEVHQ